MCTPETIAIAATIAGTTASVAGQKKAQRAMGQAQAAENMRQSALRDEANAVFSKSLSANTTKNRSQAEAIASAKRNDAYLADLAVGKKAEVASSYGTETPRIVADESAARNEAGKMGSSIDAKNKAALAGFGDVTQANAVKNARARIDAGTIADFMKGSASAHGAEMDYASHRGDSLKTVGDILTKIGMVAGMYGAAAPASAASDAVTLSGASGAQAATSGVAAGNAAGAAGTQSLAAASSAASKAAAGIPASATGVTAGALKTAPLNAMAGWELTNPTWVQRALQAAPGKGIWPTIP